MAAGDHASRHGSFGRRKTDAFQCYGWQPDVEHDETLCHDAFRHVVDIIMENNIYSIVGGPNSPHPFHMHSRRFWIIVAALGPSLLTLLLKRKS